MGCFTRRPNKGYAPGFQSGDWSRGFSISSLHALKKKITKDPLLSQNIRLRTSYKFPGKIDYE